MSYMQHLDKSAQLTQGLAKRLGVDLSEPFAHDAESAARVFRSMVFACMTCAEQEDCTRRQAASSTMDEPPDYCRNMALWNHR